MVQAQRKAARTQSAYFFGRILKHLRLRLRASNDAGSRSTSDLRWQCAVSLDGPLIAMLASSGLLVAAIGRAIHFALA
jgi:hypothetical protein